LLEQRWPQL
jgi:hypothetical protein